MPAPLTRHPGHGAKLRDWLRPVSAQMLPLREVCFMHHTFEDWLCGWPDPVPEWRGKNNGGPYERRAKDLEPIGPTTNRGRDKPLLSEAEKARCKEYRRKGWTWVQIARVFDISVTTAHRAVKGRAGKRKGQK